MPQSKNNDLQKHTMNLRQGDYDKMQELFPKMGAGPAIRQLVSSFIDRHFKEEPK
jgi:hypothetical protein